MHAGIRYLLESQPGREASTTPETVREVLSSCTMEYMKHGFKVEGAGVQLGWTTAVV